MPVVGNETSAFAHPVWSPDGSRLAVTRPGYAELWTVEPDGDNLLQVTADTGVGYGFSWSPDGESLLARASRSEGPRRESAIRTYDLDTGKAETLTPYRARIPVLPRWSPDGTAALLLDAGGLEVFERPDATPARSVPASSPAFLISGTTLSAVQTDTGTPRIVTLLEDRRVINAVPSPDHDRVAFEIVGGNLYVMNADGSGLLDLGPGNRPTWSPDGRWIAFMRTEDDGERFTASDLWAVRADGGALVALTQTPAALEMNPSWSPDGTSIAYDNLSDGTVYLLPLAR